MIVGFPDPAGLVYFTENFCHYYLKFPTSDGDRDASSKFVRRNVRRLSERKHSVDHPPSNTVFYWPTVSTVMLWSTGHATYDTLRYDYEYDNKNSLYHTCIRPVAVPRWGQTGHVLDS